MVFIGCEYVNSNKLLQYRSNGWVLSWTFLGFHDSINPWVSSISCFCLLKKLYHGSMSVWI